MDKYARKNTKADADLFTPWFFGGGGGLARVLITDGDHQMYCSVVYTPEDTEESIEARALQAYRDGFWGDTTDDE